MDGDREGVEKGSTVMGSGGEGMDGDMEGVEKGWMVMVRGWGGN